jgi:hypothetical protein
MINDVAVLFDPVVYMGPRLTDPAVQPTPGIQHTEGVLLMKMKTVLFVLLIVFVPGVLLAADNMREGMWEITSTMEMPGMPMKMPPTKIKHCYTKEDIKDQKKMVNRDKNCTVTELKSSGNKISWKMKCTGQSAGTFSGETVFSGDSYDSVMKMQADTTKGQPMTMKIKGKRVGACP